MSLTKEQLIKVIIQGRLESYVSKTKYYNPYIPSDLYDWHFEKTINGLRFTDSYRGFNPYSGVEYVFFDNHSLPVWSCDYLGYITNNSILDEAEIYNFLKEARGKNLKECGEDLLGHYEYRRNHFRYMVLFREKNLEILEKADIYFGECLVAQHVASGRLKKDLV